MMSRRFRCLTLSDFNTGIFNGYLANDPSAPDVETIDAPFGQVRPILLDPNASPWAGEPDFAIVWTRPEGVIEPFRRLLAHEPVEASELLAEVDEWIDLLETLEDRVHFAFVPTWTLPADGSSFASSSMNPDGGPGAALLRMNARLVERLGSRSAFHILDATAWLRSERPYNPKMWYMSKTPFGNEVFRNALGTVKAALRGISGQARKLILLDLDGTLWGGIVGEVGPEGLRLGGHDPVGEAYVDLQRSLKALTRRGVLLGIVSKNDEEVALDAIRHHPEMVLDLDDFAGWRIDWEDKARNVAALTDSLELGLQSVVFIDDSAVERARVSEALPEVLVPDWPTDPLLYPSALEGLDCFDTPVVSEEDRKRTEMYVVERKRRDERRSVGSLDEWLESLEMTVSAEPLGRENLVRAAQLLNKTNQMNLSTRRMSETGLMEWAECEGRAMWAFRVTDRFGDSGLTALLGVEVEDDRLRIIDYLLSCRVMGRKVEETLLAVAVAHARSLGLTEVRARYVPTEKNRPCLEFWERSGFEASPEGEATIFRWFCREPYPVPESIELDASGCRIPSLSGKSS